MTDKTTEEFTNELNRLVQQGLSTSVAMDVIQGERKEDFEVAAVECARRAEAWATVHTYHEASFAPKWDYDPEHFYLSMDGAPLPKQINPGDFQLFCADVSDVASHLEFRSARSEGPWSEEEHDEDKTAELAYRWAHGLPVTPPLISPYGEMITIVGGRHRFHLARCYGAARVQLLVRTSEFQSVRSILKSATPD